jgi:hypothetical protein
LKNAALLTLGEGTGAGGLGAELLEIKTYKYRQYVSTTPVFAATSIARICMSRIRFWVYKTKTGEEGVLVSSHVW